MIWLIILGLGLWLVEFFFTVRMTVIDLSKISSRGGKIDSGLWSYALFAGVLPIIGMFIAIMCSDGSSVRKALFLSSKAIKPKQPYIRKALGKVFMIGGDHT